MRLKIFLLATLLSVSALALGQSADSTQLAFRKGRGQIGLSGSISSSKVDQNSSIGNPEDFLNNYTFDISAGKFIADRQLLGIIISTNRRSSFDILDVEREILYLGGEYRYYLGKEPNMGLFLQGALFWSNYYESTKSDQTVVLIDKEIEGQGMGGLIGVGYAYAMADLVVFEVGFNSLLSQFNGVSRSFITGETVDVIFNRFDYRFYFGFSLLFGKPNEK